MAIEKISSNLLLVDLPVATGSIDAELQEVNTSLGTRPKCDVIIDFSKVELITSSGISNLLILYNLLADNGKKMILCNLAVPTKCIFTVAGLNEVFTFAEDRTEALSTLNAAPCGK